MADLRSLVIESGKTKQVQNADALIVGSGIKTASGNLTITPNGTELVLAANKNMSLGSGSGAVDLSAGSGLFKTTTGTVTIGPGAVGVSGAATFSAAGTAVTVDNDALVSGALTVTGVTNVNGGVQRSSAGAMNIGTTANTTGINIGTGSAGAGTVAIGTGSNITAITLGRSGMTTTVAGDFAVTGSETITGTTQFDNNATFNGNVTFGNATTDTVAFTSRVGPSGTQDINFVKELAHIITVDASTTTSTAGGALTVDSGDGSPASGGTAGAAGGALTIAAGTGGAAAGGAGAAGAGGAATITGGPGGAGSATGAAGAGSSLTLAGGVAGANGGAGGAGGGNIVIRGGAATGAGTNGTVTIGATNTSAIAVGASGVTTTVTGGLTQLTGAVSLTANGASSFTTSSGALTITAAAGSTWSTSAGALTLTSAAAATWSTAAGALTVSGFAGINLQNNGSTMLAIGSNTVTVQAGVTLAATGTGNINLPNNASARFQIEGAAVTSTVTAANLTTLTNGSNADSLHTHAGLSSSQVVATGLTTTGLADGDFGYLSSANTMTKTDAAAIASARVFGANEGTAGSMTVLGIVENAKFTTVGGSPSVGAPCYVALASDDSSTAAGKLTATAPATGVVAEVGLVMDAANYAGSKTCKILIQVKTPVEL